MTPERVKFTLDTKVLRFADRDIVQVMIGEAEQGFYRSSGRNSGMAGSWLPFDGIGIQAGGRPWFDKSAYVEEHRNSEDPLYRYGSNELKSVGARLDTLAIPKGEEATISEINNHISEDQMHRSQKNQKAWESIMEWEEISAQSQWGEIGATCQKNRVLDCCGIAVAITDTSEGPQAFCRDKDGSWWPAAGMGTRPDGSPLASTELYHGEEIPAHLQGYGTEELKTQAEQLNEKAPGFGGITTEAAINNTISEKNPEHPALQLNLQIADLKTSKESSSGLRPAENSDISPVLSLAENKSGRDFILGDLHGNFDPLVRMLKEVGFNPLKDRVLCTGDLCDRGPKSKECTNLLKEPWFYTTKGNHDLALEQILKAYFNPEDKGAITRGAGAALSEPMPRWVQKALETGKTEDLKKTLEHLESLPIILSVGEGRARFHVVHGSLSPTSAPSPRILSDIEIDGLADNRLALTDPENLIRDRRVAEIDRSDTISRKMIGARETSLTYCGHTPIANPRAGLHTCIDTGAGHKNPDAGLTLVEHKTGIARKVLTNTNAEPIMFFLPTEKKKKTQELETEPPKLKQEENPDAMNPLPVASGTPGKKGTMGGIGFF